TIFRRTCWCVVMTKRYPSADRQFLFSGCCWRFSGMPKWGEIWQINDKSQFVVRTSDFYLSRLRSKHSGINLPAIFGLRLLAFVIMIETPVSAKDACVAWT